MSDAPSTPPTPPKKYVTWSEEHDIPKSVSRLATIVLQPNRFLLEGPPELIRETQTLAMVMEGQEDDIKFALFRDVWSKYHVLCSVTGEKILLCDLRYWDLSGLIYSRPDLVPST